MVTDFYKSGKRKLEGLAISDKPVKFNGEVVAYFENGNISSISTFNNGINAGNESLFFPNGKPYLNISYTGKRDKSTLLETLITAHFDSLGTALIIDGNGSFKGYDQAFKTINEEGAVKDGKRAGEWKFNDSLYNRVQTYDNAGQVISGRAINIKTGETKTYTQDEVMPSFPGGLNKFALYLSENLIYPKNERRKNIGGKVVVQFIVEKDGRITNVTTSNHVTPDLDKEAMKVIENSPKWTPGVQYGFPVRAQYTVPINFVAGNY